MAISICHVEKDALNREIDPRGNEGFTIACYEDDMRTMSVPIHWHEEFEYIAAVEGQVTVMVGRDEVVLRQGDAVFINGGCLHSVCRVSEGISVLRSLVILPKLIGGSRNSSMWRELVLPLSAPDAPSFFRISRKVDWGFEVSNIMLRAWQAITDEIYDYENEARYLASKALRIMIDHNPMSRPLLQKDELIFRRMKMMLSYIDMHYMEDLTNQDLMELCACSESVLLRCFRQVAGTSPMQYVLNHRIEKAKEKLLTTDEKSSAIAISCGFHDFSYFTKVFKRRTGMTSVEYRKKMS